MKSAATWESSSTATAAAAASLRAARIRPTLLVWPEQFRWLIGEDSIGRYEPPESRHFATVSCRNCGCSMPWHAKSGRAVVVPASALDDNPGIEPMQNVFWGSRAAWYREASELPRYDELPQK